MKASSDRAALLLALGLLATLLLPTSNLMRLDGLPLATPLEVVALLIVAPLGLWPSVRGKVWRRLQRLRSGPRVAWLILFVVLTLKIVLLVAGPMQGWPGCYRPGIAPISRYRGPIISPHCERSFDNPFFRGGVTRFDRAISFAGDTWNLGFFNSSRFDFYDWLPDSPLRSRLPFEASWSGDLRLQSTDRIAVEYVGEGSLRVDGVERPLAPSYAEVARVEEPLAAGTHVLELRYQFDDGSRSGQDPDSWGPRAMLRVSLDAQGAPSRLLASGVTKPWTPIAVAADLGLGLLVAASALALGMIAGRELLVVIMMATAAIALYLLPPDRVDYVQRAFGGLPLLQVSFSVLAMLLLVLHAHWRRLSPLVIYFALAALALATIRQAYPAWDYVSIRGAGNDNLTAESQARTILQTGSLQGEEAIFYAQPLYRYIKFGEHALFGEGEVLYGTMGLLLALGGAFFVMERFRPPRGEYTRGLLWLVAAAGLLGVTGYYLARFVRDGMAEYATWVAMLWAFTLVLAPIRDRDLVAGALLLGIASITRTNQIPGNALVLIVGLALRYGRRWRSWLASLAVHGMVCLLPLAHNLVYGGALVFTTTSANVASNLILGPQQWVAILGGNAKAVGTLLNQVRLLLFAVPLDDWQAPVGIFAHLIVVAWVAVAVYTAQRRAWRSMGMMLLPIPYFLTHLIFVVQTYYPRHAIMVILVMALGTLAISGTAARDERAGRRSETAPGPREPATRMG